ncbi:MAG: hypothetical protein JRJ65_01335 [Deltaproteobacteria bacterium]|nr:hypothetical protein [Deltaproteobacteria bacterium]
MNALNNIIWSFSSLFPYLLGGVILLILLLVMTILLILRGSRKKRVPKKAEEASPPTYPAMEGPGIETGKPLFPVLNLRMSFIKAINVLKANIPGRKYRYRIPWFLMMGEEGSGKTTALSKSGLNLSMGKGIDIGLKGQQACNWWFFDRGVILDVAGDFVLRQDGRTSDEKGWRALLRLLQKYRPERPLDGIVLTIPCSDLLGPKDQIAERLDQSVQKAVHLYEKLWKAQKQLGLRFPVYILITKCDKIKGFKSLCRVVPHRFRNHIFGWSNPYAVDTAYSSDWVAEAFNTLDKEVRQAQMELFTEGVDLHESDELFLLPMHFQSISESLRIYLDNLFKETAYHESFLFRGLYFCGDSGMEHKGSEEKTPFFLKGLFEKKIFPEFGLARPATKQYISRNRTVLVTQGLTVLIAIVWGLGLWWSCGKLNEDKKRLLPVFEAMNTALQEAKRKSRFDTAFINEEALNLVDLMGEVRTSDFSSIFIPPSWFSDKTKIVDAITVIYDEFLMKSLYVELNHKAKKIVTAGGSISKPTTKAPQLLLLEETPEFIQLRDYVEELKELEENISLYSKLAADESSDMNMNDLAQVVSYLFGIKLPPGFYSHTEYYQKTLGRGKGNPIDPILFRPSTITKVEKLIQKLYNRLFQDNILSAYMQVLLLQLDSFGQKSRSAVQDRKLIHNLLDTISQMEKTLAEPELEYLSNETFDMGQSFDSVLLSMEKLSLLGPNVRLKMQKSGEEAFKKFKEDLKRNKSPLTGPILHQESGEVQMALSEGVLVLKQDLDNLLSQEFMVLEPGKAEIMTVPPGTRLIWDAKLLEEAVERIQPYEGFIKSGLKGFPRDLRRTIKNTAQNSFGLKMLDLIGRAQDFKPVPTRLSSHPREIDIRSEIKNFKEAGKLLSRLLTAFEQLDLVDSYLDLSEIVLWQTSTLLETVDKLLKEENLYRIKEDSFSWWKGDEPIALAAFNTRDQDELQYILNLQRERVKHLAYEYAEPIVTFFLSTPLPKSGSSPRILSKWERILSALDRFEKRKPRNSVTILEKFILFEMDKINPINYSKKITKKKLAERSGDFFLQIRNDLRRKLYRQCQRLIAKDVAREYTELKDFFNQRLAGKFPFASIKPKSMLYEVTPEDIRDFYHLFDRSEKARKKMLETEENFGISVTQAYEFLDQMEAIRRFFSPFLETTEEGKIKEKFPVFDLDVKFRVNQRHERGGNQIIYWKLFVGDQELTYMKDNPPARWRFGDSVRFSLRWAKDSPEIPIGGIDLPEIKILGRTVEYESSNLWALLHFLRKHTSSPGDFDGLPDPRPHTLKFQIQTRGGGMKTPGNKESIAKVFIRITPMTPREKRSEILVMPPFFPDIAPELNLQPIGGKKES